MLVEPADAAPVGGVSRHLNAASTWVLVGTIPQGEVFRPDNTVLTAEGIHVHEAYLVVRDDYWVGFWLPYEKAFAAAYEPIPIRLKKE